MRGVCGLPSAKPAPSAGALRRSRAQISEAGGEVSLLGEGHPHQVDGHTVHPRRAPVGDDHSCRPVESIVTLLPRKPPQRGHPGRVWV